MTVGNSHSAALLEGLERLTHHHLARSLDYKNFVASRFPGWSGESLENLPFLPVGVFKGRLLKSVPDSEVRLVMESSGTSGLQRARIAIDSETSRLQAKSLSASIKDFFGATRFPMVLLTRPSPGSKGFSASRAAVNGFARMASHRFSAYSDQGELDFNGLIQFLELHASEPVVYFGFTFEVWEFLRQIGELPAANKANPSIVIHGGGWKRFEAEAVGREEFSNIARSVLGNTVVRNYYGMVEQTGSIYFECEVGFLHPPESGDFLIRQPLSFEIMGPEQPGIVQVFSVLQRSYPGHSLLTEDTGYSLASCKCGRETRALVVLGRLRESEVRGCSDATA